VPFVPIEPTQDAVEEPAPTPTPGEFMAAAVPIIQFASGIADRFQDPWGSVRGPSEEAALLGVHGRRVAALCRGVGFLRPSAAEDELAGRIRDAIGRRYEWVSGAAEQLTCCGTGRTGDLEAAQEATRNTLEDLLLEFSSLAGTAPDGARTWISTDLGVTLSVPAGWVLVRSDFEMVLLAPARFQRIGDNGLGMGPRANGSAVRVWTVSRPGTYTLDDALRDAQPLMTRYGEPQTAETVIVGGVEGVQHTLKDEDAGWQTRLTVFALEGRGYFFEAGCPVEHASECFREAGQMLDGLRLGQ